MKASTWISIVLAAAVVVFAVMWFSANSQKTSLAQQNDSIKVSFEEATRTISEIQGHLDSIETGISGELITDNETPGVNAEDRKTKMVNNINNMKKQIEADKKRIAELEASLGKSKHQVKGIQELMDKLKASLADKEKLVAELTGKLGLLNETLESERSLSKEEIAKRDQEIADKQKLLAAQEKDINTIFYVVGQRQALIDKKVISRQGGLLGFGKISTVKRTTDLDRFETWNLLEEDGLTFTVGKKGYSILTNQNPASFKIEKTGNKYTLRVINKELFRKTKALVIEIL
jgi:uncharacterized coiled-coil protein SlyX